MSTEYFFYDSKITQINNHLQIVLPVSLYLAVPLINQPFKDWALWHSAQHL